jgi:hypothetical protein
LWFVGDEKTRHMAIVLTQQTVFYLQPEIAKQFLAITTRASNTCGFFCLESDLIKSDS